MHSTEHQLPRFYHVGNWILRAILFKSLLRVEVFGRDNVPSSGALIVVVNHISFLDPPLAGAYFPRDLRMMAKVELFETPILRHIVSGYGAFPIRRGEGDAQALKFSLRTLRAGGALFLAPEGTRSKNKQLQRGKEGVALLAARTGAPIIPVGIAGQEQWLDKLRRLQRAHVQMRIGEPFLLEAPIARPDRLMLAEMTDAIMQRLARELPAKYRGEYATFATSDHFTRPLENT